MATSLASTACLGPPSPSVGSRSVPRLKFAAFLHLDYPGARQAMQVVRWRREWSTGMPTIKRVYLITSLDVFDATMAQLAAWIRGHWGIENRGCAPRPTGVPSARPLADRGCACHLGAVTTAGPRW
ncbi:hypothetical protein SVEN_6053 [Streptomyces venezuelae ATCC 10712]|uniref:Uncharacterized protein n=1 Tax=Streptomyces venezuelae (strain ATCC 10712 / CBS 650.69 / DSM 40230 / JCM 4526 / NBRC 13096 / PD 04745) TaxID=953739 RepID=F2RC88_STRVP|nr:hypothetical protein SVEN_6053 [Streptomyces venezuelae ATCC 10712]